MAISSGSSNITKSSSSIELYQGESKDLELEIVQEVDDVDGNPEEEPVNLTSAKVCFTVRKVVGDPEVKIAKDSTNALQIEILTPATDGLAIIHIVSDDTQNLDPGKYVFDVWVVLSSGKKLPVIEVSDFIVKEPVTKDC
ncbi:MAG: hypothetical protein ACYTFU_10965 [Planctomycetota bacterium]|jgi:hypothetical protein